MLFVSIMHHYLLWHYIKAFAEIWHVWTNLFWFTVNFFSLPQLVQSFFAPWKRITMEREKGFNFEDMAGAIIINFISRIIGFILRFTVVVAGSISLILLILALLLTYIFWVTAPLFIAGCLFYGVLLII